MPVLSKFIRSRLRIAFILTATSRHEFWRRVVSSVNDAEIDAHGAGALLP